MTMVDSSVEVEAPSIVEGADFSGGGKKGKAPSVNANVPSLTDVAGTKQPAADEFAKQARPERGANGTFQKKPDANDDVKKIAMAEVRKAMLARETDGKALDGVKPKGQDQGAKTDPGKPSATAQAKLEQTSHEATSAVRGARQALALEGWTEDDLADLSDAKIVALGKKATELHAARDRKLRENAQQPKTDADPAKSSVTAPAPKKGEEVDGELEALAKEHFAGFEDDAGFTASLAKFSKAVSDRTATALRAEVKAQIEESQRGAIGEARFERALDRVRSEFPQVDTQEGRDAVEALVPGIAKSGVHKDAHSIVRAACAAAFTDQAREQAERDYTRSAKESGQVVTSGERAMPVPTSDYELARREVRKAMAASG